MPSFDIRLRRVLGFIPRIRAAPLDPSMRHRVVPRTCVIWRRSTSINISPSPSGAGSGCVSQASLSDSVEPGEQNHCALNDVFELAYVAGPAVALEDVHHLRRNHVDALSQRVRQPFHEMPSQQRDVASAIAQRGQRDGKDIQPIVQIPAESAVADFVVQISIGRRNNAHVDIDGSRTAQTLELAFLDGPQQLGLQLERELTDLVQKNGAAVGHLEAPDLGCMSAGERAALTSE